MNRIVYYRQRNFTEKLNATLDFIRENWRALLRWCFYVIMPVCLVQTFVMNSLYGNILSYSTLSATNVIGTTEAASIMLRVGLLTLCFLIGSSLLAGLVYALMQTYSVREERLQNLVFNDIKGRLFSNALRVIALSLFMFVVFCVIIAASSVLIAAFSSIALVFVIPLSIAIVLCLIPLMLILPTYLFERNLTLFGALGKAWTLGTKTLWGMLGLIIVISLISSVIQTITMMPWYLTMMIGNLLSAANESGISHSVGYKFALYLLGLLQSFGVYFASTLMLIGLAFQYFHAREKVEGVSVEANIDNFSNL